MNHVAIIAIAAICLVKLSTAQIIHVESSSFPKFEETSPVLWSESTIPVIKSYKIVRLEVSVREPCTVFVSALKAHLGRAVEHRDMDDWHGKCLAIWTKRANLWVDEFHQLQYDNWPTIPNGIDLSNKYLIAGITMLTPGNVYTKPLSYENRTSFEPEMKELEQRFNETLHKDLFWQNETSSLTVLEYLQKFPIIESNDVFDFAVHDSKAHGEYEKIVKEIAAGKADNLEKILPQSTLQIYRDIPGVSECDPAKWQILESQFYAMHPSPTGGNISTLEFKFELFIPEFATGSELLEANPFVLYSNRSGKWCEYPYIGSKYGITWNDTVANETCFRASQVHDQSSQKFWIESRNMSASCPQETEESSWTRGKCYDKKPEKSIQGRMVEVDNTTTFDFIVYCYGSQIKSRGHSIDCPESPFIIRSNLSRDITINGKGLQDWFHKSVHFANRTYFSLEKSKNWVPLPDFSKPEEQPGKRNVDPDQGLWNTVLYYYCISITLVAAALLIILLKPYLSFSNAYQRLSDFQITYFRWGTAEAKDNDQVVLYDNNDQQA